MSGIVCEKRIYQDGEVTHSHPYAQMVFPLVGAMRFVISPSHEALVDENSIFLLPYDCAHSFEVWGKNQFLILNIPSNMIEVARWNLATGIKCPFNEKWKAIRYLILDEMQSGGKGGTALSKLYYYFIPEMLEKGTPRSVQYINEHYNENIAVETLSSLENYSITYYGEWFKKTVGKSPMEYIQQCRIERAKELLVNSNLSIMQIAGEVGYSYESSFTKIFKLRENISPKNFRETHS